MGFFLSKTAELQQTEDVNLNCSDFVLTSEEYCRLQAAYAVIQVTTGEMIWPDVGIIKQHRHVSSDKTKLSCNVEVCLSDLLQRNGSFNET